MVSRFILLVVISLGFSQELFAQTEEKPKTNPEPKTLDSKIQDRVQKFREKQKKGALVVAMIHPMGNAFHSSGTITGKEGSPAPTATTPFEIGSITKVFTGILLSEAVERGELRLDDPLSKVLQGWKIPEVDTRQITALDLTTHTSGLPPVPVEVTTRAILPFLDPYATYTAEKLKKDLEMTQLAKAPGASHAYSNLGVGLLGTALAIKSGKPHYNNLVKERILDPWGMKATVPNQSIIQGRPVAYSSSGSETKAWTFDALSGAGCLTSTAEDMLTFSRKFIEPGEKRSVLARVMRPWRELRVIDMGQFQTRSVGLGAFQAKKKGSEETIYWNNGGTGGFSSFWAVIPEKKIAIVIMASVSDRAVDKVGWDLLAEGLAQK